MTKLWTLLEVLREIFTLLYSLNKLIVFYLELIY